MLAPLLGGGMTAKALDAHFQQRGAVAGARPAERPRGGLAHRGQTHAIDRLAGNVEGRAALGQRRALELRQVVLDHIDDGQAPALGHDKTLSELALVGGAVADQGDANLAVAAIGVGEGETGSDRRLRARNPLAAEEIAPGREHVHGAALAARNAVAAPDQLRHHRARVSAAGEQVAVHAIGGDELVAGPRRLPQSDGDRLLADAQMTKAADQAHGEHLPGPFLEAANEQHGAKARQQIAGAKIRQTLRRHFASRC